MNYYEPSQYTYLIVHDVLGSPTMDWIPDVTEKLRITGATVITPEFPRENLASFETWNKQLQTVLSTITGPVIMIGHGIGGTLLLTTITATDTKPDMLILVGSPVTAPTHLGYKKFSMDFFVAPIDMTKVRNQVETIYTILGINDPFVEITQTKTALASFVNQVIELPDAGHIISTFGYSRFPELLTIIDTYHSNQKSSRDTIKQLEEQSVQKKLHNDTLVGITTMEQQIDSIIDTNNVVIGSELLRQVNTQVNLEQKTSTKNPMNIIFAILTLLLLGVGGYLFYRSIPVLFPGQAPLLNAPNNPSRNAPIIIDELTSILPITLRDVSDTATLLQTIIPTEINPEKMVYGIPFNKPTTLADLISSAGFLPNYQISSQPLPVFYGVITVPDINPFLIITIPTYDTGYDLIKSWTDTMYRDIGIYMLYTGIEIKQAGTEQTKTNEEIVANNTIITVSKKLAKTGEQSIISDNENNLFSWIFLDETHILIIKNKDGISEIIKRYHQQLRS